ncbi:PTS sugar transporter subunit IIB [Ignavigranum ruoffiae]|uniref:PTS system, N-acetylgalactosamine-specific IIB component n=1 Tax=Ignavigranum ruoffiae TaxID=89093 RepID=A0A1H8ZB88_9LACT|nr:PTS sugar transporter subunit IIB [Ignavigranum ruoffiae]UPQ85515.1 PTS sugar transporter subunit IIB [Ignavigranum ruoffiae]SEP60878.1 PTS system, N-acetylgalactosamine-specific IIB component [Ignavigranum ruoffiae]
MSSIEVALVDEHFMHGKVAVSWCSYWDSHLIIVVNDELVGDKTRQGLLEMAVPDEISTRFYSIEKAIRKLSKLDADKRAVIITKTLDDLLALTDAGIFIPRVVLSSIPFENGDLSVTPDLSLSAEHIAALRLLQNQGVSIESRQTPEDEVSRLAL